MTARRTCAGCSRPLGAERRLPWCVPCGGRMPTDLAAAVLAADRQMQSALTAATGWLKQHPHATEREMDVLVLAAQGRSNEQIAAELHVTVHTVKDCWRNLSKRWGCRGQAHVVATAFQLGYLTITRRREAA